MLLKEHILSFKSLARFERTLLSREAKKKSQEFPLLHCGEIEKNIYIFHQFIVTVILYTVSIAVLQCLSSDCKHN